MNYWTQLSIDFANNKVTKKRLSKIEKDLFSKDVEYQFLRQEKA